MKKRRYSRFKSFLWKLLILVVIIISISIYVKGSYDNYVEWIPDLQEQYSQNLNEISEDPPPSTNNNSDSRLDVYFFDVGQADSILLIQNDESMLVDTGNAGDADTTFKVSNKINLSHELNRLGITNLDYLIATHPHEDHMGSMYKIIKLFDVRNVYANNILPESEQAGYYKRFVSALDESSAHFISHTTLSESEIIERINEYNSSVSIEDKIEYNPDDYHRVGDTFNVGEATVTILGPNSSNYSDTNDTSIVLMMEFQGVKIMLTGDAGISSEKDILQYANSYGVSLAADVLKVGHHGSRTASSESFITAVHPKYAIIMVGKDNSYGLPDEDVIERLEKSGAQIYMTKDVSDIHLIIQNGTIQFDLDFFHEQKEEK